MLILQNLFMFLKLDNCEKLHLVINANITAHQIAY